MFFALFGFIFLATQYLQFVLGYSAFDAGVRTLPFAVALMVMAPLSSKTVQWFGTKRVVVTGMVVFAAGLVVASTSTVSSGYPRVMLAMVLMGTGMGLSVAPATESIMGSLPLHQAGVGSAVNDTSREVGGALGRRDRRQHALVALLDQPEIPSCPRRCPARCATRPTSRSVPHCR